MEWWSAAEAGLIGGLGGGAVGVAGALIGVFGGLWAPRGLHKGLVLGSMIALTVFGAGALCAGLVAIAMKQPYHVWFPLTLGGLILASVVGGLIPMIRTRYRHAEQRRLGAEEFRRSAGA